MDRYLLKLVKKYENQKPLFYLIVIFDLQKPFGNIINDVGRNSNGKLELFDLLNMLVRGMCVLGFLPMQLPVFFISCLVLNPVCYEVVLLDSVILNHLRTQGYYFLPDQLQIELGSSLGTCHP